MKRYLWQMIEVYILTKKVKKICFSDSFDPAVNLSIEEYLMSICKPNEVIMFLWQNSNTVVIGRHQNPHKECQMKRLKEDKVNLVRRLSGGGAVYHDLGNLNFTFIAHEHNYNIDKQLEVILKGIQELGIESEFSGRNDLMVKNKKISGNAFMNEKDVYCHHGTLLVDVKLDKLALYLTPSKVKVTCKGIDSVRARVGNLKEFNSAITVKDVKDALVNTFKTVYKGDYEIKTFKSSDIKLIENYIGKYRTWEWNIGESPKCKINHLNKFSWGAVDIAMDIENGIISRCFINTDAIVNEEFDKLSKEFIYQKLHYIDLETIIDKLIVNKEVAKDLKGMIMLLSTDY